MPLALAGTLTIAALLIAILTRTLSSLVALFVVPFIGSLAAGCGLKTGTFIVDGIRAISPVIGMFVFAILFFGILTDAKVLEPIFTWMLSKIGSRPSRIVPCSALLALLVHLDGSGAVVFLVTIPALLPLYQRVGIDRRILACVTSLAAGVNFLPWTGPTMRAATALHLTPLEIFKPMVAVQAVGLAYVFGIAWWLGSKEERRLIAARPAGTEIEAAPGIADALATADVPANIVASSTESVVNLPPRFFANIALLFAVLAGAISGFLDPVIVFMAGTMIALLMNFSLPQQQARLAAHAPAALLMCSILFSAGAFSGIMKGSGMLAAMATVLGNHVPQSAARHIPFALGLVSMPLSLVFDPDSFYLGVLPIIAKVAGTASIAPLTVAQSALLGQMTTGFPISPLTPATFLVVGLSDISLGEHQRFTGPYLLLASVLMTLACVAFGIFAF